MERIVLGYTGSLETSAAIPWLADRYQAEVIAVVLDVGQRAELVEIRERALALGARRCHVVDVREELVRDYVLRALQAGALQDGRAPQPRSLVRPLIVRKLIDIARMEGAAAIAHCGDADRFAPAAQALAPFLRLLAPADAWEMSRAALVDYTRAHGVPAAGDKAAFEVDANLWGRSLRLDPASPADRIEVPEELFALTRAPRYCPDQPAYLDIEFTEGVPVRANGIDMTLLEMIDSLETIAGAHGVGRIELTRELVEAPAAVVLHVAHNELSRFVISSDLHAVRDGISRAYAELIDGGKWFSHAREALDAFVAAVQPRVTGSVKLELSKGACRAVECQPRSASVDGVLIEGR